MFGVLAALALRTRIHEYTVISIITRFLQVAELTKKLAEEAAASAKWQSCTEKAFSQLKHTKLLVTAPKVHAAAR